jgi:hypothetical protein
MLNTYFTSQHVAKRKKYNENLRLREIDNKEREKDTRILKTIL